MAGQLIGLPGIKCPDCGAPLLISMPDLICGRGVECACGVTLRVDEARSQETLKALRELHSRLTTLKQP